MKKQKTKFIDPVIEQSSMQHILHYLLDVAPDSNLDKFQAMCVLTESLAHFMNIYGYLAVPKKDEKDKYSESRKHINRVLGQNLFFPHKTLN